VVGAQFDSMLGKLIVYAQDRPKALARLRYALEETVLLGVGCNQSYLLALCSQPQVIEGRYDTGFLEREMGTFAPVPDDQAMGLIALARAQGMASSHGGADMSGDGRKAHPSPWLVKQ